MKKILNIAFLPLRLTYTKAYAIARERIDLLKGLMRKAVAVLFLMLCLNGYASETIIQTDKQVLESLFAKRVPADFYMQYTTFDFKGVSVTQEFILGVSGNGIYKKDVKNVMQIVNSKPKKSL